MQMLSLILAMLLKCMARWLFRNTRDGIAQYLPNRKKCMLKLITSESINIIILYQKYCETRKKKIGNTGIGNSRKLAFM